MKVIARKSLLTKPAKTLLNETSESLSQVLKHTGENLLFSSLLLGAGLKDLAQKEEFRREILGPGLLILATLKAVTSILDICKAGKIACRAAQQLRLTALEPTGL